MQVLLHQFNCELVVMQQNLCVVPGGPGCGRGQQCKHLVDRFIGWVHLRVGDLLRQEFADSQDATWLDIASQVHNGDLAPSVRKFHWLYLFTVLQLQTIRVKHKFELIHNEIL